MNVIKVMGGLGNQLFQYAFGKVQEQNGIEVMYDLGFYDVTKKQRWPRPYRLDKFSTNVNAGNFLRSNQTIKDHKHGFDKGLLKKDNCNFDGYWQFKDYYMDSLDVLRKNFTLKKEHYSEFFQAFLQSIQSTESVGVHVRRGDYLVQTWGILPFKYYLEAFNQLDGRDKHFFIFSDDIAWCKSVFQNDYFLADIHFVELCPGKGFEDFQDFELLKNCKHQIIASSTFSWWAAMLNPNPSKQVICYHQWLGGTVNSDFIYPKEWIKL